MSYPIVFSNSAAGQFRKIRDKKFKERIISGLEYIAKDPLIGKSLQAEFKGCNSYRMGNYRIIYSFNKEKKHIGIISINHRREVYR